MTDFSMEQLRTHELVNQKMRARGDVRIILKFDRLMDEPHKGRDEALAVLTVEIKLIPKKKAS